MNDCDRPQAAARRAARDEPGALLIATGSRLP